MSSITDRAVEVLRERGPMTTAQVASAIDSVNIPNVRNALARTSRFGIVRKLRPVPERDSEGRYNAILWEAVE